MWMNRAQFQQTQTELATLRERARLLGEQNKALWTTNDWLRVRVTQVEKERAALISNYMGVTVPVPEITPASLIPPDVYNQLPDFNDVGEAKAKELGIGWNADGTVRYDR